MNKTTCTIIIFSLFSFCSLGQTTRKTTYLDLLKTLAEKQHLKLSYSNDLLALSDSTDFIFSTNPDSCLT